MERDDAYWEAMSRGIERGEYTIAGPVELGPAAPQRGELEAEIARMNKERER